MRKISLCVALILAVTGSLALSACGKKGPLEPPPAREQPRDATTN